MWENCNYHCLGSQRCRKAIASRPSRDPASVVSRSCLSCVTILPQLCHDPASVVSRSCLSCVTILPQLCHDPASSKCSLALAVDLVAFSFYSGERDPVSSFCLRRDLVSMRVFYVHRPNVAADDRARGSASRQDVSLCQFPILPLEVYREVATCAYSCQASAFPGIGQCREEVDRSGLTLQPSIWKGGCRSHRLSAVPFFNRLPKST